MYRASQESLAETVTRLERELAEMQGLSGSPRRRVKLLTAVTAASVVASVLLGVACATVHARAERLQRHMTEAAQLLDSRAQDLQVCVDLAQEKDRTATQCKIEWLALSSRADVPQAKRTAPDQK
jgi:hypothetical protein